MEVLFESLRWRPLVRTVMWRVPAKPTMNVPRGAGVAGHQVPLAIEESGRPESGQESAVKRLYFPLTGHAWRGYGEEPLSKVPCRSCGQGFTGSRMLLVPSLSVKLKSLPTVPWTLLVTLTSTRCNFGLLLSTWKHKSR